ncbi:MULTISPECIES: anti-sigma factor family protein [unclassified Nocardiopsis]|uniref:anti-sigma factor family protein n=1 Tax=Nocardiopsis TaxID=2013 RepID=UPI00387B0450
MTSHPDVEALAFFAEELLEPGEERTVAHHLETCATCAATLDELTAVSGVLADAPPVPPMPQDVAALLDLRIDEAVRERAARPADAVDAAGVADTAGVVGTDGSGSADAGASDGASAPVVPITRARGGGSRRGFNGMNLPRLMMVAAAGAVVLGGGGAVLNTVLTSQQADGAGSAAEQPMMQDEGAEYMEPEAARPYKPEVVASGTGYTADGLADQAAEVLAATPTTPDGAEENTPVAAEECATLFTERTGVRITLVDDATFDGGPALVLFAPGGDDTTEVYVVDPADCDGVLAQETVAHPGEE